MSSTSTDTADGWESERDGVRDANGWPLYLQRIVDLAAAGAVLLAFR